MANKKSKVSNVPNLRFKGFEGEWESKTLCDIAKLITKGTTPSKFVNQGIKFIKIECFDGDKIDDKKCLFIDEQTHNKELKRSILKENDLLFAIAGATIGKVNIVYNEILPANTNQALAIIRLKEKENARFIYQILKSEVMRKYIKDSISVGAQPNLNLEQINNFSFFQPNLLEQQKIATLLDLLDERIQTQSKIIRELNVLKSVLSKSIFSQSLRFKDENRNEFPRWVVKKLGQIGAVVNGLTYSPNDIHEKGILVLRSSNVQNRNLVFDDNLFVNTTTYNPVQENDILICVRNGSKNLIGKNAMIRKENEGLAFGAFMSIYRSPFNQFIFQWFDTREYKEIVKRNLGATINSINGSDLKKFPIPFPSIQEQQKIANLLSSIDSKIDIETQLLQKLEEQKKFLLQQMFV